MTATEPGQICTEIGYVEAKKSGWCFFGASIWELAYATSNGTDGRLITKWESETANVGHGGRGGGTMNVMAFLGGSDDDVSACPTADGCGGATGGGRPRIAWDAGTQGPIYVSFCDAGWGICPASGGFGRELLMCLQVVFNGQRRG